MRHPAPVLTSDGSQAGSDGGLARMMGTHRDFVRLCRKEGAPTDRDLRAWLAWLDRRRYWRAAFGLRSSMPDLQAPVQLSLLPGGEALRAEGGRGSVLTAMQAVAQYRQARAQLAELKAGLRDGRLILRCDFQTILRRALDTYTERVVAVLSRGWWTELEPALASTYEDTRTAVRRAHDQAVSAMCASIRDDARSIFESILQE